MKSSAGAVRIIATVGSVVVLACHQTGRSRLTGELGSEIGDTTAFRPRIVAFNALRDRVTYELGEPAHLVFLAVVPGKTIEPVSGVRVDTAMTLAGTHETAVFTQPAMRTQAEPWHAQDQVEYQRCVERARRPLPKKARVVRDSTGKQKVVTTDDVAEPDREVQAERQCEAAVNRQSRNRPRPVEVQDRYLLVIASNVRLPPVELLERLAALTVTATDVSSTMAAIPEGLFLGRRVVWSGYWVPW